MAFIKDFQFHTELQQEHFLELIENEDMKDEISGVWYVGCSRD